MKRTLRKIALIVKDERVVRSVLYVSIPVFGILIFSDHRVAAAIVGGLGVGGSYGYQMWALSRVRS